MENTIMNNPIIKQAFDLDKKLLQIIKIETELKNALTVNKLKLREAIGEAVALVEQEIIDCDELVPDLYITNVVEVMRIRAALGLVVSQQLSKDLII